MTWGADAAPRAQCRSSGSQVHLPGGNRQLHPARANLQSHGPSLNLSNRRRRSGVDDVGELGGGDTRPPAPAGAPKVPRRQRRRRVAVTRNTRTLGPTLRRRLPGRRRALRVSPRAPAAPPRRVNVPVRGRGYAHELLREGHERGFRGNREASPRVFKRHVHVGVELHGRPGRGFGVTRGGVPAPSHGER